MGVFGCFIEEGAFWGVLFNSYSFTIRWFLSVLEDHDCESTLFWFIFWAKGKVRDVKRVFFETSRLWDKGGAQMIRWIMGMLQCMV